MSSYLEDAVKHYKEAVNACGRNNEQAAAEALTGLLAIELGKVWGDIVT